MPTTPDTPSPATAIGSSACYSVADVVIGMYLQMPGHSGKTCWCKRFRLPCVPVIGDLIITNEPYLRVISREFTERYTNAAGIPFVTCECAAENFCIDADTAELLIDERVD